MKSQTQAKPKFLLTRFSDWISSKNHSKKHKTSTGEDESSFDGKQNMPGTNANLAQNSVDWDQVAIKTQNYFISFTFHKFKNLLSLVDVSKPFGIYGNIKQIPNYLKGLPTLQILGEEKKIKGIAELAALNFQNIIILGPLTDKLYSIIFYSLQKMVIGFNTFDELLGFVRAWEKQIWSHREEFVLNFIHKFTLSVTYFDSKFWVILKEPVYDITTCYDWKLVNKDPQNTGHLQEISYFLRCFYLKEFISMVIHYRKVTNNPTIQQFIAKVTKPLKHHKEVSQINFYGNQVILPEEVNLKKMRSEGMNPFLVDEEKIQKTEDEIERIGTLLNID